MTRRAGDLVAILAMVLWLGGMTNTAGAAGKDATGTWTLAVEPFGGNTPLGTLKLKQEGEKLTGTVTHPGGKALEIRDGKVTDGRVSFQIQLGTNGPKIHHTGKLEGDTIKGKTEFERMGEKRAGHAWEAKRTSD